MGMMGECGEDEDEHVEDEEGGEADTEEEHEEDGSGVNVVVPYRIILTMFMEIIENFFVEFRSPTDDTLM